MIIEIPDDNSIIKWKKNEKDEWKVAEISDLIKALEERPQGDLISRSALKEELKENEWITDTEGGGLEDIIDNMPSIEQEVYMHGEDYNFFIRGYKEGKKDFGPKQGEWLKSSRGKTIFFCSECGREIDTKPFTRPDNFPFCHCGASMKGSKE